MKKGNGKMTLEKLEAMTNKKFAVLKRELMVCFNDLDKRLQAGRGMRQLERVVANIGKKR